MITLKTIIIDDEPLARQRIKRLLQAYEFIDIVAEGAHGKEGLELINELSPDLVFLDIEMPVMNGFEMLAELSTQPKIIFTTAYDQYAMKAFEENSVDYLLKPIEKERLAKTMLKLQTAGFAQQDDLPLFKRLIEQLRPHRQISTLTVKIGDRMLLVKLQDIYHIEAEEKYVFLHCDGYRHLTDFTLASLEGRLPDNFVRVHRSSIINCNRIKEIRKSFNGAFVFVMDDLDNSRISSSRGYGEELRERFEM
jgi:two-component system LytT family response regulator